MKRDRAQDLVGWLHAKGRKPLILRGARQVGKTWLIRDLAESQQRRLVELNFERLPRLESLFQSNDPQETLLHLATHVGSKIDPLHTILFLDEIQAAPHLLAKLRWFAEDMPELPVVAAGSLLDFALEEHEFSMPVGRVGYLYLEPLSFEEFLDAIGQGELRAYLCAYELPTTIPEAIHAQLMKYLKEYLVIGGMPAAVASWIQTKDPNAVSQIHFDLLATYRDDFPKYRKRLTIQRLEDVMNAVPRQLGHKFVYKEANAEVSSTSLKQALDLLTKARICHRVVATAAGGLPLGAEADDRFSKVILLDCGLCSASLGLSLSQLSQIKELSMLNNGGMAKQLAGGLLRTITPPYVPPSLYYWQRHQKGAEAEIDYVMQYDNEVLPIEVKAGTTGTLRSLHQFMKEKKKKLALRINSDRPSFGPVQTKDSSGALIQYNLLSLPFYLVGQLHRFKKSILIA